MACRLYSTPLAITSPWRRQTASLVAHGLPSTDPPLTDSPNHPPEPSPSGRFSIKQSTKPLIKPPGGFSSMAKQMVFEDDCRQPLLAGISKLARAVRSTLGPRGRNAVLDKGWGSPKVTKDGVTVAEDIELTDPYENLGAQLVKEAASKTNEVAGDGTTTATVLAEAIFREGIKMIAAGYDPMALSRGVAAATEAIVEEVNKLATPISEK